MPKQGQLVNLYKKVIDPKFQDWVVFENGTCVIIYNSPKDLEVEAKEVLRKYGSVTPGTPSGDFNITKVDSGWVVTGDQPGILNFVSEVEGKRKEDFEIGLIGRSKKELDYKEPKIIYINIEVV